MRDVNVLLDTIDDIQILIQFLYMDKDHSVLIHNEIGVPLEIRMEEDLTIKVKNLNFPTLPPTREDFGPNKLYQITEGLKKEKAILLPKVFDNRWEEIKAMTIDNVGINRYNRHKGKEGWI